MRGSSCFTPSQLLRILDQGMPPEETLDSEAHLDECQDCRALLVDLVKTLPDALWKADKSVLQ